MMSEFWKGFITGSVLGGFTVSMLLGVLYAIYLEAVDEYDEDDDQK